MEGAVAPTAPSSLLRPGKMFVNPLFDYLLIGGIVSWVAGGIIYGAGVRYNEADLFWVLLVSNWAHFAASTVRLYTKPDAVRTCPSSPWRFPSSPSPWSAPWSPSASPRGATSSPSTFSGRRSTTRRRRMA